MKGNLILSLKDFSENRLQQKQEDVRNPKPELIQILFLNVKNPFNKENPLLYEMLENQGRRDQ